MTEHECPKAFYCLPESCGDCPRDQQDEQAEPTPVHIPSCERHPGVHHLLPSHCNAYAEGERAATERIVKWLRGTATPGFDGAPIRSVADAIERGEHE